MKIIRWLLSHTILILLIVVVIYGYMFWGNLLGDDTPAGKTIAYLSEEFEDVAEFVDAVKAKQENRQQQTASDQSQVVTSSSESEAQIEAKVETAAPAVIAEEEAARVGIKAGNIEQKPVSISYSHNDMRIEQDSEGGISTVRETATAQAQASEQVSEQKSARENKQAGGSPVTGASVSNVESNDAPVSFVPVEVKAQLDNLDEQGKVIDASKNETLRESWIVARKSFYQRNYKKSEQSYLKVIDASENNYDAYGELGNVYFNQGKNEQAASAYYEAAAILVRQGQKSRARSLMGLLRHLDKSKAVELKKLLDSPA